MTKKRFNNVGSYLYDGDEPIGSYLDVNVHNDVCELLNSLNDENEQLKVEIQDFQELLADKEQELLKPIIRMIDEKIEEAKRLHFSFTLLALEELRKEITQDD